MAFVFNVVKIALGFALLWLGFQRSRWRVQVGPIYIRYNLLGELSTLQTGKVWRWTRRALQGRCL